MISFLFSIGLSYFAYARSVLTKTNYLPYKIIYQKGFFDCGIACLQTIALGKKITLSQADLNKAKQLIKRRHQKLSYFKGGISLANIVSIAEMWNLQPHPVKANYAALLNQKLPVLAHLKSLHYVVVLYTSDKYVIVADPTFGIVKYYKGEFDYLWSTYLVLFNS